MAEARTAVERRKASASRWTRGRARSASRWQHLIAWRGPTGQLRLFGAPPPLIFWRQKLDGFGLQNSGAVSRENESACHLLGSASLASFSPRAGRRMG